MVQKFKNNMKSVFNYNVSTGNVNSIRMKLKSSPGRETAIIAAEEYKIKQLMNKKAKASEAGKLRAALRKNKKATLPRTARASNFQVDTNSLPRNKKNLIDALIPLISQTTNDRDLQDFLISIYDETSNDTYTKNMFGGKSKDEAKRNIAMHVNMFSKSSNAGGLYRGSEPQMEFSIKGENMINLAYLMYLDMLHDATIPKNVKFEDFCKAKLNNQPSPVYYLFGSGLTHKRTKFIKTMEYIFDNFSGSRELAVKSNLPSIYPDILKREMTIRRDQVNAGILTPGHNMFLCVDQEDEKATLTLDISKTKYEIPGTSPVRTAKIMYPLVSVANLMDPGKNMLIESAKENSKYFMRGIFSTGSGSNNNDFSSRLTWNYKRPKFIINHDKGKSVIEAYYTDRALNLNSTRATKRGYAYRITNPKKAYNFAANMSKSKAKEGSTGDKVAKFLGDFLQALTVVSYIKNNRNPKYHYCLATGDAMLANNFVFLCSRSGVSPNLWMATSTQQISKVYGKMINDIKVVQPSPTQVINVPNNNRGVVSSGNNRTEGGGNSNNRGFNGSGSYNRKKVKSNPSARKTFSKATSPTSTARSSVGSVSRNNNNNNEIQSVATKLNNAAKPNMNMTQALAISAKLNNNLRAMKIPNNVRQNFINQYNKGKSVNQIMQAARRIVADAKEKANRLKKEEENRKVNNLTNKLKGKGLPNVMIKGYINSYKNGTRTVNQITREANNIAAKLTAGTTALRKETLRKRS
tara:strand:+ start:74 stop:2320 length:2247 start_codon:yes stop_codon:yes gene_type:complete